MHLFRSLLLTLLATACFAQKRAVSILVAGTDGKPLSEVCVKFETEGKPFMYLTDFAGKALLQHDSVQVTVSKTGYQQLTLFVAGNVEVVLREENTELNQTVVTGNSESKNRHRNIQQVQVLGPDRIRQQAAPTLADLMQQQLNIRTGSDPFLGSNLSLAGVSGQNVKILVDGIPVSGRENGNTDVAQLNLSNVQRIEIVEGPMSVIYGSDALGGVVNLITKNATGRGWKTQLNGYTESRDRWNTDGRMAFTGKKMSCSAGMGRYFFGGYAADPALRQRDWKPKTQWFGDAYVHLKTGTKSSLRFAASAYGERLSCKGNVTITPDEAYAFDQYFFTRRLILSALFERHYNQGNKLQVVASYQHYQRALNSYRKDMVNLTQYLTGAAGDQDTNTFQYAMSRGVFSFTKRKATMQAGYDASVDAGSGTRIAGGGQVQASAALFHTADIRIGKKWNVRTGLRLALHNRFGGSLLPSIHAKYDLRENLLLRAGFARGFRTPGLKELYLNFVDVNHQVLGNPNLRAEISDNLNASVLWKKTRGKLRMELNSGLYFNHIKNKIALLADATVAGTYRYANFDRFAVVGGSTECAFRWNHFMLSPGFAINAFRNFLLSGREKYSPNSEWTAKLSRQFKKTKTEVAIFFKHTGRYTFYQLNADGETYFKNTMQAFNWLDVTGGKYFCKGKLYIAAGGKNLLNITSIAANLSTSPHGGSGVALAGYGRLWYLNLSMNL